MTVDASRLLEDVERILGPEGLLAESIDGYSHRAGQLEMAIAVARLISEGHVLVAEGGTGIGKTLAYLTPALLSGLKVVVATGTKTLQEQIFTKDLPVLLENIPSPLKATYMKGRSNYLCKLRFSMFTAQRRFRFAADGALFDEIEDWAGRTRTGDRSELAGLPDDYATWPEISSNSDNCLGKRCRHYEECFITEMRRRAQEADLVIVNHHLYFADLAVREQAFGGVIPPHDLVILDEAHQLESVATQYFGIAASNFRFYSLVDDINRILNATLAATHGISKACEELRVDTVRLFDSFLIRGSRFKLNENVLDQQVMDAYYEIDGRLDFLRRKLESLQLESEEAVGLARRVKQLSGDLAGLLVEHREDFVYWGEVKRRGIFLHALPLVVAPMMEQVFFSRPVQALFTSATLSTGEDFSYFRSRIGVPEDAEEAIFLSPFDYRRQSLLFLPRVLPEPSHHQFTQRAAEIIGQLVRISGGSALLLFTSYANMDDIYDRLKDRLPFKLLRQGDAPRNQLLEQFRQDVDSVLFATGTFWQGVDVLGDSLRLVVIDKLPFESPGDPITEGRIQYMRDKGENPFFDFQVPAAIMGLKQGTGRLIRSRTDWGIIALLDRRVRTKGYGKRFLKAMPDSIRAEKLDEVRSWWRRREEISALNEREKDGLK